MPGFGFSCAGTAIYRRRLLLLQVDAMETSNYYHLEVALPGVRKGVACILPYSMRLMYAEVKTGSDHQWA